jgi:uncharacterized protein (TIGR02271 family)
MRAKLKWQ